MKRLIFAFILLSCFLMSIYYVSAIPVLAGVVNFTQETYTGTGGATNATGGYIANRDLNVQSQTNSWQGYYGQVVGNLSLADASGFTMYTWAGNTTIRGEVFASLSNSVTWSSIVAQNDCTTGEAITGTGDDRVNKTFTNNTGPRTNIGIANQTITANTACSTNVYESSNAPAGDNWEEYILTDGSNTVWTAEINSSGTAFDGNTEDFQLIVPANQSLLTYYMYVELG